MMLFMYCSVVVVSLLIYGLLQERLMSLGYGEGDDLEYFKMSTAVVFCNRIACFIFAFCLYRSSLSDGEQQQGGTPFHQFGWVSLLNITATSCQYQALIFVSFPLQALAKSCKMIPVMCWGAVVRQKKYTAEYWLIACVVTGGCVAFIVGGDTRSRKHRELGSSGMEFVGILLLAVFLACDGLTSVVEEKIMADHAAKTQAEPNRHEVMMKVSGISCLFSVIWLAASGEGRSFLTFAQAHPMVLRDIAGVTVCSVFSQWAIFAVIAHSSALTLAATMNVRQITGLFLSVAVFQHPLTHYQCYGLVLACGGIVYKIWRDHSIKKDR
jgi:adenosine 3'-phospho 5'-phosphosulfate transporter B2